jgi:hypothetical protein
MRITSVLACTELQVFHQIEELCIVQRHVYEFLKIITINIIYRLV